MVEVTHAAFIVDAAGTFSCFSCYQTGNRSEIHYEPLDIIKEVAGRLK